MKRKADEKIKIKVSIYDEVTVPKCVANYICMLAFDASVGADNVLLADEYRQVGFDIYNKLLEEGYYAD